MTRQIEFDPGKDAKNWAKHKNTIVKDSNAAVFDAAAGAYDQLQRDNLGCFGGDLSFFAEYKIALTRKLVPNEPENILEFGCGVGRNLPFLQHYFPNSRISGCDVSGESLALAGKAAPEADLALTADPEDFLRCYARSAFGLITAVCVLHHIPEKTRADWLSALYATLRPGGTLLIFEHNPYNPLTRRIFNTCPFDAGAKMLSPGAARNLLRHTGFVDLFGRYTLFFPWRGKAWRGLETALGRLPLGGQYFLKAGRPEAGA
ncbi:MAG: class I SAM-dependent methyltransferase [Desulfovibrio sp.]|jgi:SAM-dependent methyltransferase|nr:class I SAM-dependent methyltransferase [Desulfovibrio sp.]